MAEANRTCNNATIKFYFYVVFYKNSRRKKNIDRPYPKKPLHNWLRH